MTPVPPMSQPGLPNGKPKRSGGFFDATFSTFVTPSIVRIIYVLAMIVAISAAVISVFVGLNGLVSGIPGAAVTGLLLGPLVAFVLLLVLRLSLELTMVIFDIADNLRRVRKLEESRRPPGPPHLPSQ